MPDVESLLVVTGIDANSTDSEPVRAALDVLRAKADVQLCQVALPGDLHGALHRRGGRTLVVVGGDASLHTVVSALHRRRELDQAVVGMLPVGPSEFSRAAGIPTDLEEAAHVVLAGAERRFDLIQDCRGDIVVNAIHLGARAGGFLPEDWRERFNHLVAGVAGRSGAGLGYLDERGLRGDDLTGGEQRERLWSSGAWWGRPLRVRVEADGSVVADFDRPVVCVDVHNGPGRHGRVAADPCDGQVDVVVKFAVDRVTRVRRTLRRRSTGPDAIARADGDDGDVVTVRARQVAVAGQRFWMRADGGVSGYEQRCTWKVEPHRLRMIVPA